VRNVVGELVDVGGPYWLNMTFSPVDGKIMGSGQSYDRSIEFVISGEIDLGGGSDEQIVS
jgi:hypothetical protein